LRRKTAPLEPEQQAPDTPSILIREQISQMAPATMEDMDSAPENTDAEVQPLRGPNGRLLKKDGTERAPRGSRGVRVSSSSQSDVNPLMSDPRYVEAIQGMNFYGASRIIKRGFKLGAKVMNDPEIALATEEEKHVDNYFYAVSKHAQFDPMATLFGRILLFLLLMGELVLWRWLKYSPLGVQLKKMLKEKEEEHSTDDSTPVM
jgi:hypothetical protein